MDNNNLLISLHKWSSNQDENFITEVLVYLLNYYLLYEYDSSISIIKRITNGKLSLTDNDLSSLLITTQAHTHKGIPDIRIENNFFLGFIEVKVDSNFGSDQLSRYKAILSASNKQTGLISLTRYDHEQHGADISPDYAIRWHEISDWLSKLQLTNIVSKFLTKEYIKLLEHRGLAMNQVSWQLTEGVRALKNVLDMLGEAISACGLKIYSKSGAWQWMGYYIEDKRLFAGVYYDNAGQIVINTEVELNDDRPNDPDIGLYQNGGWRNIIELGSEDVHFFSRSKASQLACLEKFVAESVEFGRKVVKT